MLRQTTSQMKSHINIPIEIEKIYSAPDRSFEDIMQGLVELQASLNMNNAAKIYLDDQCIELNTHDAWHLGKRIGSLVGSGGFKLVYDIGDGRVLAIRNIADSMTLGGVKLWTAAVYEEKWMSDKLRSIGLESQQFGITDIKIGKHKVPVLIMPSFEVMAKTGLEVRDQWHYLKPQRFLKFFYSASSLAFPFQSIAAVAMLETACVSA